MKNRFIIVAIWPVILGCLSFIDASAQNHDSTKQKEPFMKLHLPPKYTVAFGLYRRGTYHINGKVYVFGSLHVEDQGVRFIPMTTSPEGYLPQQHFDSHFWFNSIFKEVFIPYADVKSIRRKFIFRMKDGRKLYLLGFWRAYWKPTLASIRDNVARAQSSVR